MGQETQVYHYFAGELSEMAGLLSAALCGSSVIERKSGSCSTRGSRWLTWKASALRVIP